MKRRICTLLAWILSLCLLCGCSDFSWSRVGSFLTGEEQEALETDQTQEAQTQEEEQQMASESVLMQTEAPEVLRLAYQAEYGLNPYTTVSLCNRTILSLLYEPLYLVNGQFQAEPVLAADSVVSEDGRTTTITLQQGVCFHSGQSLTAQDVIYSYETARQSAYYGNRFIHIDTVTAEDERTVTVTTDTSYESVSLLLDFPIIRSGTAGEHVPDGTGPFMFNSSTRLKQFENWWQDAWALDYDTVELTLCTTAADIRDQFEYGNVNLVCTDPSSPAYATFHSDNERWSAPTTIMQYVGFNLNSDVFSNSALRACITYAIDRDTIVAQDLSGYAIKATLPASPLANCYDGGLAADYDYDPDTFQAMLEEAQIQDYTNDGILDVYYKGYAIPIEGEMIVSAANTQRLLSATRIADALNALGFDITVTPLDEEDFQTALLYGNYELYYGEIRLSPNFDLGSFFRSGGSVAFGGLDNGATVSLCASMLENSGNAYDLHKRIMDQGYLCPILFKSYAVYTTRGLAADLDPSVDWILQY